MEETREESQVLKLLLEKYRALEEIQGLTDQLAEAIGRKDEVSVRMVLKMRAQEMARIDRIQESLWNMMKEPAEESGFVRRALSGSFLEKPQKEPEAERIRKIRLKTRSLIGQLKAKDQKLNLRAAGEKSWYRRNKEAT